MQALLTLFDGAVMNYAWEFLFRYYLKDSGGTSILVIAACNVGPWQDHNAVQPVQKIGSWLGWVDTFSEWGGSLLKGNYDIMNMIVCVHDL